MTTARGSLPGWPKPLSRCGLEIRGGDWCPIGLKTGFLLSRKTHPRICGRGLLRLEPNDCLRELISAQMVDRAAGSGRPRRPHPSAQWAKSGPSSGFVGKGTVPRKRQSKEDASHVGPPFEVLATRLSSRRGLVVDSDLPRRRKTTATGVRPGKSAPMSVLHAGVRSAPPSVAGRRSPAMAARVLSLGRHGRPARRHRPVPPPAPRPAARSGRSRQALTGPEGATAC